MYDDMYRESKNSDQIRMLFSSHRSIEESWIDYVLESAYIDFSFPAVESCCGWDDVELCTVLWSCVVWAIRRTLPAIVFNKRTHDHVHL
jgi:hypothetical protein